jgi:acyl carrier protein
MASQQLKEVVANALRIEPEAVTDDIGFGKTPEWDSLNHVTLMMSLESEFGVTVTDDEVVELTDLPAIERFLTARASDRHGE